MLKILIEFNILNLPIGIEKNIYILSQVYKIFG